MLDSVIHRINPYPADKRKENQLRFHRYPVDNVTTFEQLGPA